MLTQRHTRDAVQVAGIRCNSSLLTMPMLHQTLAFTPGELVSHSYCKFLQVKLHTVTGQLHTPGLRAERVPGLHLCVTVRWVAGASPEWLQRLRQKLTDVPHAGLGEVRCRQPTLNCLCTDRVMFIYQSMASRIRH